MESVDIASMFLLLAAVATGVVAYVVIYNRKKRKKAAEAVARAEEAKKQAEEVRTKEEVKKKAEEAKAKAEKEKAEAAQAKAEAEAKKAVPEAETERPQGEAAARAEKAEEGQAKAQAGGTQNTAGAEHPQGKSLDPVKRGGRPLGSTQDREKERSQETKSSRPKPEITCWKRERQWIPAVELPEDYPENAGLSVSQNGSPLTQEVSTEGCWTLRQVYGEIKVRWNEDEISRETTIELGGENYLLFKLFKLSGQSQDQGRRVHFPSSGSYLVMVPDNWERDEALSGPPPVTPEPVFLTGYLAHFYNIEKASDGEIAFRTPDNKLVVIQSKASRFELVGTQLDDASEDMGPLFGERPPKVHTVGDQTWGQIDCIVVREEGRKLGEKRWREVVTPADGAVEIGLGGTLEKRGAGWYSLLIYDKQLGPPLESIDFRFAGLLKSIAVPQFPPFPPVEGHRPVSAEFHHEPGCVIQSADGSTDSVQITRESKKTILTVPSDPICDKTCWRVGSAGGPRAEVAILVERLWWALGQEEEPPSGWKDTPITLSRGDLAATSNKAIWIRLPTRRWTDVISVGFVQSKGRIFSVKAGDTTVCIPLRDFGDSQEVANRAQEHSLKVWIKRDNGLVEGIIAIIPAVQAPKVEPESPVPMAEHVRHGRPTLNPAMISVPRLANVLTSLRRRTRGTLRVLIREVRQEYPRGRAARRKESAGFVKKALCMINFALEFQGDKQSRIIGIKKHWVVKARLARDEFPDIMNWLQNRYEKLNISPAYRSSNIRAKR